MDTLLIYGLVVLSFIAAALVVYHNRFEKRNQHKNSVIFRSIGALIWLLVFVLLLNQLTFAKALFIWIALLSCSGFLLVIYKGMTTKSNRGLGN